MRPSHPSPGDHPQDLIIPPEATQQEQTSPEEWFAENCAPTVATVELEEGQSPQDPPAFALLAGPVAAPETTDADYERRLYTYDETSGQMTPIRVVEPGEQFCWDPDAQTRDAYSAPRDEETTFQSVTSPEYPDGVWLDLNMSLGKFPLDSDGNPKEGATSSRLKAEYRWQAVPVSKEALEGATETVDYCSVVGCGG